MGQNRIKVNPGDFVESMKWLKLEKTQSSSGAFVEEWVESNTFLSYIKQDDEINDKEDYERVRQRKLVFVTYRSSVNTDDRVGYNGLQYRINSIQSIERGLYAEYSCTSNNDYVTG